MVNKKCVFCMGDTTLSKSVEHIIPKSLGNNELIIDKSYICDNCNNYFSSHIEKPFLELEIIRNLRTFYLVPSRKNKIPNYPINILGEETELEIINNKVFIGISPETIFKLLTKKPTAFSSKIPDINELKNNYIVSRFLMKVFTELNLYYFIKYSGIDDNEEITWEFDKKMKEFFNYVRYGNPNKIYDYEIKKIREFQPFTPVDVLSKIELTFNDTCITSMNFILYDLKFTLRI